MSERRSNNAKIAILLIAPLVAVVALIALRPKNDDLAPLAEREAAAEKQAQPAPPVEPVVPVAEVVPEVAPKTIEPAPQALIPVKREEPQTQAIAQRVERIVPVKRPVVREETTETVEDAFEPRGESTGGLSDEKFRETIESWRGMKACVETSKSRAALASGALRMSLKISANGEVLKGRVFDETNEAAKKVGRCVEKQLASLKFPAFATSDPAVTKEAKFVF